ncbi:Membrane transport protein mmpL8 [Mycobacteroides salmoniphilum]|uniref:Membrane transport protein mmpL8 n=1 Tax=Mycobacteroides salmoniphilum TaxID=404941 RepID=A0A4R8S7Y9_9MYCO|nr:RND family transporter [Mycobacteroides salmoniphilum]TDZ86062.1 Membrane transport protein mmpL8 [Mycobacteroides salmoniphilum]
MRHGGGDHAARPPRIARAIRALSIPIILFWLGIAIILNVVTPSLDEVGKAHSVSMSPKDAPSMIAMMHTGKVFGEFDSDSSVMIVLEGKQDLADEAHRFYDEIIKKLKADPTHVQHISDYWGDPLTASGAQSADGKSAYVQVNLAGDQGTTLANESVDAVRKIIAETPGPDGVQAYVTGGTAASADTGTAGNKSMQKTTLIAVGVVVLMLLFVYRSVITMFLALVVVGVELMAGQGVVATLGNLNVIGLSTYAVSMVTMLGIAAGTDYVIFLLGRYHEARQSGEDREEAFYTAYSGVSHVILGSGLTIVGATLCLSLTRLPLFRSMGVPCALVIFVIVAAALTLAPAVLAIGSRFGLFEPKRKHDERSWRRIGAAVVRWPGPILIVTIGIALIGLLTLPGYTPGYDDRQYMPDNVPSKVGYAAAERHFSPARMNPEMLMIEADHDMRNPSDMLVIDRVAKTAFHARGVGRVQAITRPLGTPIEHSSIPFQIGLQGAGQIQNMKYMKDRMADMLTMADQMGTLIGTMERVYDMMRELTDIMHDMTGQMKVMQGKMHDMRDLMATFDDFFRPIRNYFYWEKHCADIPICWASRTVFDALDGVDAMVEDMDGMLVNMDKVDVLMPRMLAEFPPMIAIMKSMHGTLLTMHSTMSGIMNQMDESTKNSTLIGKYFDQAKNDDSFYLPPEVFENADFKRGLKMFLSPDGKAVRMTVSHQGNPASVEGIATVGNIREAVADSIKGTPLENAKVYLGGTAAANKDLQEGAKYDLILAGIASLCLIFIIMLLVTGSVVAALVIVGTVAVSLGASIGVSVLIWQDLLGMDLHWFVVPLSVIILLAVGSDYNLLLIARFKEELHGGLKTGFIRAMGGSGKVVTNAGLVFAFTMCAMVVSDLRIVGQLGTTIGLGLLFDTLIVRSFMTPAIAALLGRWFWWPLNLRKYTTARAS